MCEVKAKLVAWFDRELSPVEAEDVSRHVKGCQECRGQVAAYKQASETFDVFCDAVMVARTRRPISRWVLVSAVVAAVVMLLVFPRRRVEPPPILTPTVLAASVPVPVAHTAETAPRKTIRRRRAVSPAQDRTVKWQPMETAVQIAIPAESMFPPGAMPNGMNFIAELSIAPDGSVQQIRLRP